MAEKKAETAKTEKTESAKKTKADSGFFVLGDGGTHLTIDPSAILPYDFKQKQPVSPLEVTFLQQIYTAWLRLFRTYTTLTLKVDVQLQQNALEIKPFQDLLKTLEEPVTAVVFGDIQGGEVGYWTFPTAFVLSIIRKLLGGSGKETIEPRALTAIEKNLFLQFMEGCMDHFCQNIYPEIKLKNIKILGLESNLNFLPKPRTTFDTFIVQATHWTLDETTIAYNFALPFNTLQPILDAFREERKKLEPVKNEKKLLWRDIYASIDVPVTVEWSKTTTLQDIMSWQEGTVLDFPMNMVDRTVLKANGIPKFAGSLGVETGHVIFNVGEVENERDE